MGELKVQEQGAFPATEDCWWGLNKREYIAAKCMAARMGAIVNAVLICAAKGAKLSDAQLTEAREGSAKNAVADADALIAALDSMPVPK